MSPIKPEYPLELFVLQYLFAKRIAEVSQIDIFQSLKEFTPYYYMVGAHSWEINEASEHWDKFIEDAKDSADIPKLAYKMYVENLVPDRNESEYVGCFRLKYFEETKTFKIHFKNVDESGFGPLSKERMEVRLAELRELFVRNKKLHPEAEYVEGSTWLYNLESYKRLFPRSYTSDMRVNKVKTLYAVLWGQFIDSEGVIKEDLRKRFIDRVNEAETLDQLFDAFEYKGLIPKERVESFYSYYKI